MPSLAVFIYFDILFFSDYNVQCNVIILKRYYHITIIIIVIFIIIIILVINIMESLFKCKVYTNVVCVGELEERRC